MTEIRIYSVRNAITGSLFAAFLAGSRPPRMVMTMLIAIRINEDFNGSCAVKPVNPDTFSIIVLIGISAIIDTPIPSSPAQQPMMNVSALNTCEILRLEAPNALRMPISFVRSITEICVMIPIIMHETIREIATNAIRT